MSVQPIRLFGDPVLRTPAEPVVDFDKELRDAGRRPDRDDARRARRRARRAADRRRPARLHLRRRRRELGHLVNPELTVPDDEQQDGAEGCLSIPGLSSDCRGADARGRHGLEHARRAGHPRGHRDARPLHPARDRPPRRRAVHRPARRRDPQGRDAARSARPTWIGRHARRWSRSARTRSSGAPLVRLVFAGTPARRAAVAARRCWRPGTRSSRCSPGRTRRPAAAGTCAARRSAELAPTSAGIPVLTPGRPRDPEFLDRARRARAGLRARSSRTARWCRRRRSTSRGTAGSTCTSRCCRPGAAPPRCSTRVLPATRSPAPRTFLLEEGLDTGPVFGV